MGTSERKKGSGRKSAERVVSDLARRGEMRARDVQKLARELFDRAERNRKEITGLVQKEMRRQVKALGLATREDVDRLRKRIRELEQSGAKRTPRASPRKPSAAKKR
jgi:polyhydroxyalkanoate synthesis regulator phasin